MSFDRGLHLTAALDRTIDCLRRIDIFAELAEDELRYIAGLVVPRHLKKGRALCYEGEKIAGVHLLVSGKVRLSKATVTGREQIVEILSAPYPFGAGYALTGGDAHLNGSALTECESYFISLQVFRGLLSRYPVIGIKLTQVVMERLGRAYELIGELVFNTVSERMASLLNELSSRHGSEVPGGTVIDLPLSRQDLADMLNCSRESVTRLLKQFTNRRLIKLIGRRIVITNREQLRKLARRD